LNGNARQRGLTLLLEGVRFLAIWAGASLLVWGICTVIFGRQSFPRLLVWVGTLGVVLIIIGLAMSITGAAIDKIIVPSWLDPARNSLLWQIFVFLLAILVIWVYVGFF